MIEIFIFICYVYGQVVIFVFQLYLYCFGFVIVIVMNDSIIDGFGEGNQNIVVNIWGYLVLFDCMFYEGFYQGDVFGIRGKFQYNRF